MANRDIVAIGASAGGVKALHHLAARLPQDFPAAILVTIHLASGRRSELDEILTRAGPLPAAFASDGQPLRAGQIFLAPPGRHLLLDGDRLTLGTGPRENNARPAIDPMMRSAAVCCGHRTIGVVLTGTQGDGASGLWALKQCGAITVVQDPRDAAFPDMPLNVLDRFRPDHVVELAEMPLLLDHLVHQRIGQAVPAPPNIAFEVQVARQGQAAMEDMDRLGRRSALTCPDCQGIMWEIDEDELVRFRCHVGHSYATELMSLAMDENLRRALASALRALEERVALARKLFDGAKDRGHPQLAETWASRAREFEQEAEVIRSSIRRMRSIAETEELKRAS